MDPITHLLTGAMIAKSFSLPPTSSPTFEVGEHKKGVQQRIWFWSCIVAAELPDADVLFYPLQLANHPFFYHRSFTHSFLGAPLWGLISILVLYRWIPFSFLKSWVILSLCFFSHVLGDWLTSYGTPIFAPFSFRPYSVDLLSNLTLFPMAIFSFSLFLNKKIILPKKKWILSGWLTFFLFLGISALFQKRAFQIAGENTVSALPGLFLPTHWYVIQTDKAQTVYESYLVSIFNGSKERIGKYPLFHRSTQNELEQFLAHPQVKRYLHFNRWPVMRKVKENSENSILIGNLLYRRFSHGYLSGALKIMIDENGEVRGFERTVFKPD